VPTRCVAPVGASGAVGRDPSTAASESLTTGTRQDELDKLEGLVAKWRTVVQRVAEELQAQAAQTTPVPPTLGELLAAFQVDPALVQFRPDADAFL
jgi:hypothetical protein